jgi:predicted Fe-S protein YdhL (DUF1289 family)
MQTPPSRGISAEPASPRHSPCVGVCQLDIATGWCLGCGRTGDEVARWLGFDEDERLAVWGELPQRLDRLGVGVRLLPWTRVEIGRWAQETLRESAGTWVTGAPGALAEFPVSDGRRPNVVADDERIEARLPDARFRLHLHDKLRAFGFGGTDGAVVLGLPKARATLSGASTLTALGEDAHAIDPEHRGHMLFDLGVGRRSSRFCVRTNDSELIAALASLAGQPWTSVLPKAGTQLLGKNAHRVVESVLARIEVFSEVAGADERSPASARTLFLPALLQEGSEVQPGLMLPDFALPVAIYAPLGKGRSK